VSYRGPEYGQAGSETRGATRWAAKPTP